MQWTFLKLIAILRSSSASCYMSIDIQHTTHTHTHTTYRYIENTTQPLQSTCVSLPIFYFIIAVVQ
jgi:hypothetical protein